MRIFLSSTEFDIWQIIEDGYKRPPTPRFSWTEGEKRAFTINAKAMNIIFCGLNEKEYNRVSLCQSAQEIWLLLDVTHEGTNQVKESTISNLTHKY